MSKILVIMIDENLYPLEGEQHKSWRRMMYVRLTQ